MRQQASKTRRAISPDDLPKENPHQNALPIPQPPPPLPNTLTNSTDPYSSDQYSDAASRLPTDRTSPPPSPSARRYTISPGPARPESQSFQTNCPSSVVAAPAVCRQKNHRRKGKRRWGWCWGRGRASGREGRWSVGGCVVGGRLLGRRRWWRLGWRVVVVGRRWWLWWILSGGWRGWWWRWRRARCVWLLECWIGRWSRCLCGWRSGRGMQQESWRGRIGL